MSIDLNYFRSGAEVVSASDEAYIQQAMTNTMKSYGLTAKKSYYGRDNVTLYTPKGVICTSTFSTKEGDIEEPTDSVACGVEAEYFKIASQAKQFVGLVGSAYAEEGLVVFNPVIKNGKPGYQNAYMNVGNVHGVGGSAILFYKTPTKNWTNFIATQNTLICDTLNTADLKAAFYGDTCYTTNGDLSKVQ